MRRINFLIFILVFLRISSAQGQGSFPGIYQGVMKGETIHLVIEEVSGSSIKGRLTDESGTFVLEGSINGNEIQSARVHRKFHDQNFRGRFLSDRLTISFDQLDLNTADRKPISVDFYKQEIIEPVDSSLIIVSDTVNKPKAEGYDVVKHKLDQRLFGSWQYFAKDDTRKAPLSQRQVLTVYAFYKDGDCGTATGHPFLPGKDSMPEEKLIIRRDKHTSWYTSDDILYFVEKSPQEKVIYKVKYKLDKGKLYFINPNKSVITLTKYADD